MPWTQASEVENDNDWAGRCNNLDIFELIDPIPPAEFEDLPTNDGQIFILEGFELDDDYVDGTQEDIFDSIISTGAPFSISTTNRGSTVTGGKSLKVIGSATVGGTIRFPIKVAGSTFQYYRTYIMFDTLTNGNLNDRNVSLFGWVDSTGRRSHLGLRLNAAGSIKWALFHDTLVEETISSVGPSTAIWYRCELVTELVLTSTRMTSTIFIYLGDTDTLVTSITMTSLGASMGGFPFIGHSFQFSGNAVTAYYDDVRIQTGFPTVPDVAAGEPLFGPGGVWPMVPSDDFLTAWTPLSGDNFENVNEFPLSPDGVASYISSAGAVQLRDLYDIEYSPDTIPDGKYIKAIQVRAMCSRTSGTGDPTLSTLYMSPLETVFAGASRGIEDAAYTGYPYASVSGNNRLPQVFLRYDPGLPTGFRQQHKIGIQRNTSSPTATCRVSMVWGYVEVSANV